MKGHIDNLLKASLPRSREGWGCIHVTTPRKPCPTVGAALQAMLPGDVANINGVRVARGNGSKSKWWWVAGEQMSYADALARLAGEAEVAA